MKRTAVIVSSLAACMVVAAAAAVAVNREDAADAGVVPEPEWLDGRELQPTWTGGMGLVLEHRCMSCHRPGGTAPMSFTTYGDVRKWTKNMRVQVQTRAMPPWPARLDVGRFRNSLALTARELDLFERWAAAGFPKGSDAGRSERDWSSEWSLGEPDAIFELPETTVAAGVTEEIREHVVRTEFAEDRWIVANEAKPGDEYSVLYIDGGVLGSYYPGNASETLPPKSGYLLEAGAEVMVKVVYRKEKGYPITDRGRLAVWFARQPSAIEHQVRHLPLRNTEFSIPPGAANHGVTARAELTEAVRIASLLPVLLERGKSVRYEAAFPDGRRESLLSIPAWDPLWQYRYQLAAPLEVPAGTVLTATAVFDNSSANVRNPDATAAVHAGPGGDLLDGLVGVSTPVSADVRDAMRELDVEPAPLDEIGYRLVHEEVNGSADSALSPDGKWFAFASRRAGNLDVWMVSTESGELQRVTDHPSSDYEARWHPDGTKLAFVTHRNGSQDVYLKDLATGEETPVATESFNEDYPSFAKDGSEIVFTGGPGGFREVQVYNMASGEIRTVTKGYGWVGSTNFSANAAHIVFHAYYDKSYLSGKSDLFIVPAQGGKVRNLTNTRNVWDYKATWSYDGELIAFSSKRASDNFNLFVVAPDGSGLRQVTNVGGYDLRWVNWTKDGRLGWHQIEPQEGRIKAVDIERGEVGEVLTSEDYISHVAPAPGGEQIAYETNGKIYLLATELGAEARELTRGLEPRWSSDGKTIAFLQLQRPFGGTHQAGLGTIAVDGDEPSAMTWISPVSVAESLQPWREGSFDEAGSPDGQSRIEVRRHQGKQDLVLVGLDGSERLLTGDGRAKSSPVWSRDGKVVFYVENRPRTVGYYMSEPVRR